MTPSGKRPVSPRLLNQLARTLRAVEAARRDEPQEEEAVGSALEDLDALAELVENAGDGALPDAVPDQLVEARSSLEDGAIEEARETLVGVGRSIDEYLKG